MTKEDNAGEKNLAIEASSAGTWRGAFRPVTRQMADEADKVFVMDLS